MHGGIQLLGITQPRQELPYTCVIPECSALMPSKCSLRLFTTLLDWRERITKILEYGTEENIESFTNSTSANSGSLRAENNATRASESPLLPPG